MDIFKLIFPGYDTDDLERDMERKSKRIEFKASLLEKEAKALEEANTAKIAKAHEEINHI